MKKSTKLIIALSCFLLITLIVINPEKYINSCLNGFLIFGKKVLPALFPFFFLTKLLNETEIVEKISPKLNKLTYKLFGTSGNSSYIFLMSIISGYPVGAKLTADFYEKNLITKKEAFKICTFTSNSGPLFIIGTVGIGMFASYKIALIILISHILGAIFNGMIYKNYQKEKIVQITSKPPKIEKNMLSDCMYNALVSIMLVGGFIAFFTIIIDTITTLPFIKNSNLKIILSGFIEITRGCLELSKSNYPQLLCIVLATFFISFGGVSIHAQSSSFLSKCEIKMGMFFLQKLSHALISCLLCLIICLIIL